MNMQERVLDLVTQISSVNLSQAFVSIELEKVQELINFLSLNDISVNVAQWNLPESLYIGEQLVPSNLVVLSLSWNLM